jgi:hypothetical protein
LDGKLYSSVLESSRALVKLNNATAELVELETPGGAVVRRFTFEECESIVGVWRDGV